MDYTGVPTQKIRANIRRLNIVIDGLEAVREAALAQGDKEDAAHAAADIEKYEGLVAEKAGELIRRRQAGKEA